MPKKIPPTQKLDPRHSAEYSKANPFTSSLGIALEGLLNAIKPRYNAVDVDLPSTGEIDPRIIEHEMGPENGKEIRSWRRVK
jgi:hypothetical protein